MSWKEKELEKFYVEPYPNKPGWIILHTPMWSYGLSIEDFKKVQKIIGDYEI